MHQTDLLRRRQELLGDALAGRLTRRQILQRGAALGVTATALGSLLGDARRAAAQTPTPSGNLVSWAPAGQRWELPQRAVYPLFQEKFPDITIEWIAEPINDYIPRTVIEMSAKSDKYDILHDDYNVVPQLIALGSLEPLQPYLEQDPGLHGRSPGRCARERDGPLPGQAGRAGRHPLRSAARIATANSSTTAPISWSRPGSINRPRRGTRRSRSPRPWPRAASNRPARRSSAGSLLAPSSSPFCAPTAATGSTRWSRADSTPR